MFLISVMTAARQVFKCDVYAASNTLCLPTPRSPEICNDEASSPSSLASAAAVGLIARLKSVSTSAGRRSLMAARSGTPIHQKIASSVSVWGVVVQDADFSSQRRHF